MAFINTGKNRGFFNKNQCKYGKLLSEFFGPSCAPGALDLARNNEGQMDNLCDLCRPSVHTELHIADAATDLSGYGNLVYAMNIAINSYDILIFIVYVLSRMKLRLNRLR